MTVLIRQSLLSPLLPMKQSFLLLTLSLLLASCMQPDADVTGQGVQSGSRSSSSTSSVMSSATGSVSGIDRLNSSPRHQEWVEVKNGDRTIYTWVVYPQTSGTASVVLLIHENKGLNDWARGMADQVAEAGYIAVAPDLLSGFSDVMRRTSDFPTDDAATEAISALDPAVVISDLQAVADWSESIPAANGKLASAGFCWGGAQSFRLAANRGDLDAALVFYGTGPETASDYGNIRAPVYGFYGGNDQRVNATIADSAERMSSAGKTYETVIYDGAGHAFMRLGEDPAGEAANVSARKAAWQRMNNILSAL
ncbi:MAG: dienelactone hydrolase family protein [Candidatus Peribacteraceae bacterium]|nr:dienelactone hydrolase family protein [Candidatus Peribacteraceae bacterium]